HTVQCGNDGTGGERDAIAWENYALRPIRVEPEHQIVAPVDVRLRRYPALRALRCQGNKESQIPTHSAGVGKAVRGHPDVDGLADRGPRLSPDHREGTEESSPESARGPQSARCLPVSASTRHFPFPAKVETHRDTHPPERCPHAFAGKFRS